MLCVAFSLDARQKKLLVIQINQRKLVWVIEFNA